MSGGGTAPSLAADPVRGLADAHDALLCTLLRWDAATGTLTRAASSRPDAYPVGGSKQFPRPWPAWMQATVGRRTGYVADGAESVRAAFFDHALIASLGCAGYCTVPVLAEGRVVGVLSALGPEGWATPERLAALGEDVARHADLVALSETEEER